MGQDRPEKNSAKYWCGVTVEVGPHHHTRTESHRHKTIAHHVDDASTAAVMAAAAAAVTHFQSMTNNCLLDDDDDDGLGGDGDDGVGDWWMDEEEDGDEPKETRRSYPRPEYMESEWGQWLTRLRELAAAGDGIDPACRKAVNFVENFRVPYEFFVSLVERSSPCSHLLPTTWRDVNACP